MRLPKSISIFVLIDWKRSAVAKQRPVGGALTWIHLPVANDATEMIYGLL